MFRLQGTHPAGFVFLFPRMGMFFSMKGRAPKSHARCIAADFIVYPHLTVEGLSPWRLQDVRRFLNQNAPPYDWSHPSAYRQGKAAAFPVAKLIDSVHGRYIYWGATAYGVVRIICPLEV